MNISRWHMNRMGLVDFWCYENEVFEFENGHMLLRGSNGSGKSVTMQSFIPLLLDGNKNSERLDAFGTRSRKMDTYLIDENSDREERIGYLYLEFKREDSDIFKTIGMGLRARRNKPLQAWYFVIEDGRRVNVDFSLIENRLTLSEKQLKNILGEQVISTQGEYMKKVNEALFGFETLDDYADAISLLIQLRSPKLSNSLNPSKINEILGKSLQPLSDEELRPMSEAIINMDNLQDQLESLKQSLKAAKAIEQAYQTYNKAVLLNKWNKYVKELQKQQQLQQEIASKNNEKNTYVEKIEQSNLKIKEYRVEKEVKESELLNLRNQNIEQWIDMIAQLKKELGDSQKEREKKERIYDSKEQQMFDSKSNLQKYTDRQVKYQQRCESILNEMTELNENLYLSEQVALKDCFDRKEENFEFAYTYQQIKEKIKEIEEGLLAWQQYEEELNKLEFHQLQKNEVDLAIEKAQQDIQQAERSYRQMVEEYLELYHQYNETNRFLKLNSEEMEELRKGLIDYESTKDYSVIKRVIDRQFYKLSEGYHHEKAELNVNITMFQEELRILKKEYENWEKMSDPEPERTEGMMKNRTYLAQEKIDYIPLYKLLDFDVEMSEEQKNQVEELLMQMHLLDALIVERRNQEIIQKVPMGCLDYYLWSNSELNTLKTVTIKTPFDKNQFIEVLTQLGVEVDKNIMIENRYFQSGIIEGSLSLNQSAVYIGYERRLRLKQEKLDELKLKIESCEKKLQSAQEKYQHCLLAIEVLNKELNDFIDEKRLKDSLNQVSDFTAEYQRLMQQLEQLNVKIKEFEQKKNQIYTQLQAYASRLMLSLQKVSFEQRKRDLLEYQEYLYSFNDCYNNLLTTSKFKEIESDKVEQLILDVDELRYEITQLEQKEKVALQKIATFQKQLDEAGYSEITQKISDIQHRLDELNDLIQSLNNDVIRFETEVEHLKSEVAQKEEDLEIQQEQVKIYQDILHQEIDYHFLLPSGLDERSLTRELRNLSSGELKKGVDEYKNQLQEVYFKQYTYLTQYNVVQENVELCHEVEDINKRIMLKAMNRGKKVGFLELIDDLNKNIETQEILIADEDRHIFEEILVNTIGKKIRERIQASHRWVEKMQSYMDDMNTSSGLQLSLKWRSRKATDDLELDSTELVELLEKDYRVLKESDRQKISTHFRSKISRARKLSLDENTSASFHQLMKEVMDYRKWFDFTLYAKKPNEQRKELTSHVFFAYSGGEKALSMYVPLFSAVAAKFESAREDAPRVIALDEAFAGVDENNIDNMFALITKFGFDYIMNSQVLWGDYPSCRSLAIYELFRPNNAPFVSVVSYLWNGHQKRVRYS